MSEVVYRWHGELPVRWCVTKVELFKGALRHIIRRQLGNGITFKLCGGYMVDHREADSDEGNPCRQCLAIARTLAGLTALTSNAR